MHMLVLTAQQCGIHSILYDLLDRAMEIISSEHGLVVR